MNDIPFKLFVVPFDKHTEMKLATVEQINSNNMWKEQMGRVTIATLHDGRCEGHGHGHTVAKETLKRYEYKVVIKHIKNKGNRLTNNRQA